jgi:hypothetical protein
MTDWRIYERDVDLLMAEEFYAVRDMTISTCCIGKQEIRSQNWSMKP